MFTINDRPVVRLGLEKAQAKLISQYMVKEFIESGTSPRMVQVWDYLVELPGADGKPTRLTIQTKGSGFQLPQPGNMVPVVVNRRRTKAHFDVDDPSISLSAQYNLGAQRRKEKSAKAKAEFEKKRAGQD
ncbi:MAG: hypothetical protein JHD16_09755 [Solirubrobacteraceae bacterium]|nr:hypothetical protein [Solirubrobacteraceae bacterium]